MSNVKVNFLPYRTNAEILAIEVLCLLIRSTRASSWCYAWFWIVSSGSVSYVDHGLALRPRYEFNFPGAMHDWFHFLCRAVIGVLRNLLRGDHASR